MGAIKAADVAKLRKQSGAGMMDCKNALVEANGDFDAAINVLRKKGQKVADKRADQPGIVLEGFTLALGRFIQTKGKFLAVDIRHTQKRWLGAGTAKGRYIGLAATVVGFPKGGPVAYSIEAP